MMGVQIGTAWYFNAHALSNGPTSANDAEDIIETARQFMANRPGEDWMVMADFNRSPSRMPVALQNHIVAADQPTQQSGNELDFAYLSTGNNNTVNADVRGGNSDHAYVRYSINGCGSGGLGARALASGRKCDAPVPGETYRFFAQHLENAVIGDSDRDGNSVRPFVKIPTGGADEAIQVRFGTDPGVYMLALEDDFCLTRLRGTEDVTTVPCEAFADVSQWRFLDSQIVPPDLAGVLQPRPNQLGASLAVTTGIYQWRPESLAPNKEPRELSPSPPAPPAGNFSLTCKHASLVGADQQSWREGEGVALGAYCQDETGRERWRTISLSDHIGNIDGVLTWGSGGFERSCGWANPDPNGGAPPTLQGGGRLTTLHCQGHGRDMCPDDSHRCEINLDDCIANRNGVLTYICQP
jgi:CVNH domain